MTGKRSGKRKWYRGPRGVFFALLVLSTVLAAGAWQSYLMAKEPGDTLSYPVYFEEPLLRTVVANGETYSAIMMPGSSTLAKNAGEPALPMHFVRVLIPAGKQIADVSVSGTAKSIPTRGIDLEKNPIAPHQGPIPFGTNMPAQLAFDVGLYQSEEKFPSECFGDLNTGFSRGYQIFSLVLYPVSYVPGKGELSYYPEMTVKIDLEDSSEINPYFRDNRNDEEWVKNLVINPQAASGYLPKRLGGREYTGGICDPADNYDYVIITTTQNGLDSWTAGGSTPYNWTSLMDKHAATQGLTCTLVTVQDILAETDYTNVNPLFNDTPARVREFCKDAYQDWGTDYILIGADAEWIPSRLMDSAVEYNVDADIYFNHLDNTFNADGDADWGEEGDAGFDFYAELYIGRVTCDVPQDVSNWLTKCFYYTDSTDPDYLNKTGFYGGDTGWDCQGDDFVDYSAIQGLDHFLGPDPNEYPYPSWLGFQYGFETWNTENPGAEYDLSVKWTAEPPNAGWVGGSSTAAINGFRTAISNDTCTLISAIAHANEYMSMDVYNTDWESSYHNTKPFFLHDYGCHCGDMDAADDGVLHSMLFHSDTELAFGCVYNSGYGWGAFLCTGSSSAIQQKSFWDYLFDVTNNSGAIQNWQAGKAMAYSRDLMGPGIDIDGSWRETIQCCLLFGDPAQLIKPPAEPALSISFPEGLPQGFYPPGAQTEITVSIVDGKETYVPGTGYLYYRFNSGDSYTPVALTALGGDLFEVVIPSTQSGDVPEFYFGADGDLGTTVMRPTDAPAEVYSFETCVVYDVWKDNFESDKGWTVENTAVTTGMWERGDPQATTAQPGDDHTPGLGTDCWVTQLAAGSSTGDYDVDGGPTRLISPTIDLSYWDDVEVGFYLWFHHTDYGVQYPLQIHISNNDGGSWTFVMTVTHTGGWNYISFPVLAHIALTSQMKVRFSVSDNPSDDIVEAALDDFAIKCYEYNPTFWGDNYSIDTTAPTGGQTNFTFLGNPAWADKNYLIVGTDLGTAPGTVIDGTHISIQPGFFTDAIMAVNNTIMFKNFEKKLDANGSCLDARLDTRGPIPAMFAGKVFSFSLLVLEGPRTPPIHHAATPVTVYFY